MSSTHPPTAGTAGSAPRRPFLGWRILAAAFFAQLLGSAVTFAAFGVFVVPLSEAFGTPRGRISLAFSIAFLVMGAMGPFVGRWIDLGFVRALMVSGAAISGAGLIALSQAAELWQMAVLYCGVVSLGGALFGMAPSAALVANWFVRRRGLALGIAASGATVASFAAPPIAAFLIGTVGWRAALAWFGAATLVIGLPVFYTLVVGRPETVGQVPDGDDPEPLASAASSASPRASIDVETGNVETGSVETGQLVRDPRLWLIAVGFGLVFTSPIVMMLTLVPFAEDLGYSRQNASYFFSAMAPFSILGKIVFGAMADRIPARIAIWLVVLGNALVWALLYTDPSYRLLLGIGALYGVGIGATAPLYGVVLALCFGRVAFGRASGIGGLASLPLLAGAPAISGYLYDSTGGYHAVFVLQVVLLLLGGLLLSFVRVPRVAGGVHASSPARSGAP